MRTLLTALTCLILFTTPVVAGDYNDAKDAYDAGDYQKALKIFLPLAEKAYPAAQTYLGIMYAKGQGVEQNFPIAYAWWMTSGIPKDYSNAQKLLDYMTPKEFNKAIDLEKEYWLKYGFGN